MNRRSFLGTLGVFSILPGAGRVWKAVRQCPLSEIDTRYTCVMDPVPQWETRYFRVWGFTHGPDGRLQPVSRQMATTVPTEARIRELFFGAVDRFHHETIDSR